MLFINYFAKIQKLFRQKIFFVYFCSMKRTILKQSIFILLCLCSVVTLAQNVAKPRPGDGITTFLQRYHLNSSDKIKEFKQLNKGKFTKNGGLIIGRSYKLPYGKRSKKDNKYERGSKSDITTKNESKYNKNKEPLFGKRYEKIHSVSKELQGACFYLVSGHGGPDPGAIGFVGRHELHEDEYAYDIILRLAINLRERGAKVHIIIQDKKDGIRNDRYLNNSERETCMGEKIPLNQVARLQQRCNMINKLYRKDKISYKRAVFIHVDSRGRSNQVDVFFYHATGSKLGKRLAENIRKTFENKYNKHQPNRGFEGTVSNRDLFVLRNSNPAAVFLELGNIQNKKDQQRLIIPSNRQALADWICKGIINDYQNRKKGI